MYKLPSNSTFFLECISVHKIIVHGSQKILSGFYNMFIFYFFVTRSKRKLMNEHNVKDNGWVHLCRNMQAECLNYLQLTKNDEIANREQNAQIQQNPHTQ